MSGTLAEKVWQEHVVHHGVDGEPDLLYIDLHLVHDVTSPQAFEGLRLAGRGVRRPDLTIATEDHNTPTLNIDLPIAEPTSRKQIETLRTNCAEFGIRLHSLGDADQGIVHVVGPQLGLTQPGLTVVCGDSHTSTHGAFGALAFGIGTSEVEHVLATQTLPLMPFRTMAITIDGELPEGSSAKDIILAIIARIGTGGGQGYVLEYRGEAIERLSMEGRMTICNMSIEAGARAGMVAPDQTTFDYIQGRPHAPEGADWDAAVAHWRTRRLDLQPQLRGPAGQGRAHPPGLAHHRRRDRDPRHPVLARRSRERLRRAPWRSSHRTPGSVSRCAAPTWTRTRSSRPSTSNASLAPGSRTRCSPPGAATPRSYSTTPPTRRALCWWPDPTSAPGP